MRKSALLLPVLLAAAFLAATLAGARALADTPAAGPRPGTVEAVQCLVRQGPAGCETMFRGRAWVSAKSWVFDDPNRDFKRGALVFSKFWGPASDSNSFDAPILIEQPTKEMDIFDVIFAHVEYSVYVSPADADGKIRALAIRLYPPHDLLQVQNRRF